MIDRRKIKSIYLEQAKKIKSFLLSESSREFLVFLFFVLIASGFWLLQTLNNDFETGFSIPVELTEVPDNVVITSEPVSELKIQVKDKGTALLNYKMGMAFSPLQIDFNTYQPGYRNTVKIPTHQLQKYIQSQLYVSSKITAISPDTVEYIFTTGQSKKVPVRLNASVSAAHQYYISDTICTPDSVLVYAPEEVLRSITEARTEKLSLENLEDTTSQVFKLEGVHGAKFIPDEVNYAFSLDMYTEKSFEIPILGVNFPADKALLTFPSKVKVVFQVGLRDFYKVKPEDFLIVADYDELMLLNSERMKPVITAQPLNVNYVRIVPEEVDFLIKQVDNSTASYD